MVSLVVFGLAKVLMVGNGFIVVFSQVTLLMVGNGFSFCIRPGHGADG